ncbi:hypothetical protein L2E82_33213 [Cichorium intybus]|uniref:Uncharacterized protein n=1 Tax=Cichorium intybus TaxID=13427 RepID=A0ACB9BJW7_CICIN|nr:hypothetical protein L2E82_33213 [Cichorium intybus]
MARILASYSSYKKTEELTRINLQEKLASEYGDVSAADELTEIIQRHLEEKNLKQLDITSLNQLERHLHNFLRQVRIRKTQLMMGVVKGLQQQEMELKKEKKIMMEEIEAARMNEDSGDAAADPQTDFQLSPSYLAVTNNAVNYSSLYFPFLSPK